ncbi:hypothetical protein [Sandarakinorhabdus sp.]|uniref:hypothetical protein n=1 Tax=Sandarakinorhabdus sp. TaxID=1916663 RepID=UPI00286E4CB5|nr:hypothetical protein [Sandarakinorhabdus sp.]
MPMANDPYQSEDRFALSGVASNAFEATPSNTVDLPVGVKAVDIVNRDAAWQRVDLVPVNSLPPTADGAAAGRVVQFWTPPNSIRPVPMRVQRVMLANLGANVTVICYTDGNNVAGTI